MKKGLKIAGRLLLGIALVVYIAVALANYSVVQSYLGTAAGRHFSQEWGGEVKIGAIHAMPWDHLILNDVLLVSPDNDTILDVERLRLQFKRFPYSDMHLSFDRVYLRNGYYHLAISRDSLHPKPITNLQYIFDSYDSDTEKEPSNAKFTVDVGTLTVSNLHYKMDLLDSGFITYDYGVSIPHMEFLDINLRAKNIHVVNDDVSVKLLKMRTRERSGFVVNQIEGDVHVSPYDITVKNFELRTPKSQVLADVSITYDGWDGMSDYEDNVVHDITLLEGTSVAFEDAAYWVPIFWGAQTQIEGEATMQGVINDMKADAKLYWGEQSGIIVSGDLQNITHIDSAHAELDIERLWTNVDDMEPLFLLLTNGPELRKIAKQIKFVDIGGRMRGGFSEHSTLNLSLNSGLGDLRTDVGLTPTAKGGMRFSADASSHKIDLRLLQNDWISHTGIDFSVNGHIDDLNDIKTLHTNLTGQLINTMVQGHHLLPIEFECQYESDKGHIGIISYDSLAQLSAQADFEFPDSINILRGTVDIAHLDAAAFKLLPEKYGSVATTATIRLEGQDLDTMQGSLIMLDTRLGALHMDKLKLTADAAEGYKNIRLQSDPVDAHIDGNFTYSELPLMIRQFSSEMLPDVFIDPQPLTSDETVAIEKSNINLHLHWKDNGNFLNTISDNMVVAKDTRITANYNSTEKLKMVLRSDSVRLGSFKLNDIGLNGFTHRNNFMLTLRSNDVNIGEVQVLQETDLVVNSSASKSLIELAWGDASTPSSGDLEISLEDNQIKVLKPDFRVGNELWRMLIDKMSIYNDGQFQIVGEGITLCSEAQSMTATLSLLHQPDDFIRLDFNNFALSSLSDILLQDSPIALSGEIGGRLAVQGFNDIPAYDANLHIDSCIINQQPLGIVQLRANGNTSLNTLNLELASDQLNANGWIALGKKVPEITFNVGFNSFELGLIAPILSNFTSRFEGRLNGNFDITGTTKRPIIVGEAAVEDGALQVDMTGVTYFINDSIQFTNKHIALNDFQLRDSRDNVALVNGTINYENLENILLALRVQTDNILLLDLPHGDDFYGTVLASAEAVVDGPVDALKVNVNARTTPGCELTVLVNDRRQVKAQNYIHFVSDKPEPVLRHTAPKKEQKIDLAVDLSITPDVQLNLPMDFSEIGVNVTANGSGDLHLSISGADAPQLLGNYEIVSGTMKLSAISLISKDFTIEEGSNLNFQGNLPDARFDLSAVYSQRVNLSTLTGGISDVGGTQKYIQVEDVINIAGTLQDPTIGFDIRLPGADASVEEEVFAYIDRSSERDMLNQTVSLLAFGHFYNANSSTGANGNLAASGSIGALSSLLTDMVSVVDIDVDYKMGNDLTKDQLDVNISKDWGRWYLESTLGYGGESRELQSSDVNSAVIDALVGYRLNPLVHLYAYNRTNTNDYTRMDLPYKQGVGLKLTKDFDNWGDLFRKKNKKR